MLSFFRKWAPFIGTALFCALCLLPPVMAFTFTRGDALWIIDESGQEWWLLSDNHPYSDRWYFWVENIGALLILLGVYAVIRSNRERIHHGFSLHAWIHRYLCAAFLGFVLLWAALSTLFSGRLSRCLWGTGYRHDGLFSYMIYGGAFLTAILLARSGRRYVRAVLECLVGVGCFSSAVIALKIQGPWLISSEDIKAGFFSQYNHQGYFNTICWVACAALFLADCHNSKKTASVRFLFRLAELWLMSNAIVTCNVRGAFLAVLAALALLHLLFLPEAGMRKKLFIIDLVFVLTCVGLNTGTSLFSRLFKLAGEISDLKHKWKSAGSGRGLLWAYGLRFAVERPVFGFGPDNLGEQYLAAGLSTDRPHNEYIQIAAMLGFPALCAYLGGLFWHFSSFYKKRRHCSALCKGCMCVCAGYLVGAAVGNSMYYTTPYFFMILGFSLGLFLEDTDPLPDNLLTQETPVPDCR